jgi:hypothetical protein
MLYYSTAIVVGSSDKFDMSGLTFQMYMLPLSRLGKANQWICCSHCPLCFVIVGKVSLSFQRKGLVTNNNIRGYACAVLEGERKRRTKWTQTILKERKWNGDGTILMRSVHRPIIWCYAKTVGGREILETYLNSAYKNITETDIFIMGKKSLLTSVTYTVYASRVLLPNAYFCNVF